MRRIAFEWLNGAISFHGRELMKFEAEEGTPDRRRENRNASVLIDIYGGVGVPPSASDEAGAARWQEVRAQRELQLKDRAARRRRR